MERPALSVDSSVIDIVIEPSVPAIMAFVASNSIISVSGLILLIQGELDLNEKSPCSQSVKIGSLAASLFELILIFPSLVILSPSMAEL
ncbi:MULTISPECIES: hypothetical protein [unclassified Bacteroides]|uniref:hypothetical protein n=1 Tax=unclassified Bacteroides TaxID=2646097 RepID=UPI000E7F50D2|nr:MULTISPECIES: hypothetical protein [unclassified Bacteroides]RGN50300.1 hypothetical protein DXB63_03960 [Bacteroides sp. OM05-12]